MITAPRRSFLAWYRRYYLLVNLPVLFLITELVLTKVDLVHRPPFDEKDDLAKGMTKYNARPPAPGDDVLLLLGNSATDRGFDPDAIEKALGNPHLRVFNFGLKAARVDDQLALLDFLDARGIHAKYVVVGVNPYLVDDLVAPDTLYPWLDRRTPYVYFHRSRIRTKLWRWVKRVAGIDRKQSVDKDDVPGADARINEAAFKAFVTEFDHRPADDFPMIGDLGELADRLGKRGITTYMVILPLAASGVARIDNYRPLLAALRAAVPAGSLDLADQYSRFTDDMFYDVGHSNAAGRVALTLAIIPWLAAKKELVR
jgi:hypothetical protein